MNVGLCLPVFARSAGPALAVAEQAEADGLDGVFCFDHLFPAGQPHRPALSALAVLAALAVRTSRVRLGPLVTRVGLLEPPVQVAALASVQEMAGGRLIAGLGSGDGRSRAENDAYGVPTPGVAERLTALAALTREVRARGIEAWIGGNSASVRDLAGREADGWNCWNLPAGDLAGAGLRPSCRRTWGGVPPADGDLAGHLRAMREAGADWVIYGPMPGIDWAEFVGKVAGAAKSVR